MISSRISIKYYSKHCSNAYYIDRTFTRTIDRTLIMQCLLLAPKSKDKLNPSLPKQSCTWWPLSPSWMKWLFFTDVAKIISNWYNHRQQYVSHVLWHSAYIENVACINATLLCSKARSIPNPSMCVSNPVPNALLANVPSPCAILTSLKHTHDFVQSHVIKWKKDHMCPINENTKRSNPQKFTCPPSAAF